ncbi:ABC transporter ATP-binding protein [Pyrococcus horikoshii]|uniref:ATP-binding cassette domain-containing protein n=2 Tax=Pyrococcus horikoshii TaxID=53953 RepID=A0A832T2F9_PYRHR|nr:ABC transporter ATP-binding protein [Pyrococcus horikoshii]BAA29904.1 323aa long hypothetical oligopeptide transport ATP-binding protein APPF [Pyrococcus horikoshii OT3]HII61330.1 ATP-binding cassette domain-containing protein [Pyrococcus horikoshii]
MTSDTLIEVKNLTKLFPVTSSILGKKISIRAVDNVSFEIKKNEILGLVGESGCGKSTLGKLLVRLLEPTSGTVLFKGQDIYKLRGKKLKEYRKSVQMVFQNPYTSFDPRLTLFENIAEPLYTHKLALNKEEALTLAMQYFEDVGLTPPEDFLMRYPHELSGGQLQRASIARAIALEPEFIVADEPTSMLDASLRSGILNLIKKLRKELHTSWLFITHDLPSAYYIADRIAVMYLGKIVEIGESKEVLKNPLHPYTQALLEANLPIDPDASLKEPKVKGEPKPVFETGYCRFFPRCPYAFEKCKKEEPPLVEVKKDHYVACWLY